MSEIRKIVEGQKWPELADCFIVNFGPKFVWLQANGINFPSQIHLWFPTAFDLLHGCKRPAFINLPWLYWALNAFGIYMEPQMASTY